MSGFFFAVAAAALAGASAIWVLRAYRRAAPGHARAAPAFMIAGAAIAAAIGLYVAIGRPDLTDAPYASRIAALKERDPAGYSYEEALAVLAEAARTRPHEAAPLLFTGQIYLELGRDRDAARAYEAALRREPGSAQAMLGLGRALVRLDEGRVSSEALGLFEAAAQAAPDDPVPWLYQAIAAGQDGRQEAARALWAETLKRLPPDDPRRAMAETMVRDGGAAR